MKQRIALTKVVRRRYQKAGKKEKTKILSEMVANCGYNRSYARRILGSLKTKRKIDQRRRNGKQRRRYSPRERKYDASVFYPLRTLWLAADGICGQRLQPFIPELLAVLEKKKEIKVNKTVRRKLLSVGSATIDRMLSGVKRQYKLKGRATTKPGTLLRSTIPIRIFSDWNEQKPGFMETDLVAFCGESVKGDYINGFDLTDIATGWVCLEAIFGKAQTRVHQAVNNARERLPFTLLGLDSDNGTEFINWLLKRYCDEKQITFTRIRPYRKNDNCFVEQKNYTVLRRFLGYGRYDTQEQLEIIREILKLVEPYVNFFQPSMKLTQKERVGAKTKKKHDAAKTPYRRLLNSGILTGEKEKELSEIYENLNPLEMKRKINKLTEKLNKTIVTKIHDLTNIGSVT
ncbi:MAG: transposase [Candidatus Woesebacteria bacterium]|nr:transposase [Candidatus Woesebacteria bacterium]